MISFVSLPVSVSRLCIFFMAVCALIVAMPAVTVACEAEPDNAEQKLVNLLADMSSLSGEFEQLQYDVDGELLQSSNGNFSLARPGKLLWHTLEPFPQKLVTDGETLWLYDPDLEQVSVQTVGAQLNQTPAVILSGDLAQLQAHFDVTALEEGVGFELRPKQASEYFQRLTLRFNNNVLASMQLLDGFGQDTQFQLKALEYNPELNDELFNFEAPEGTDILIND